MMWKLGLWPRNSFSGNICFQFSVLVLCSVPQSSYRNQPRLYTGRKRRPFLCPLRFSLVSAHTYSPHIWYRMNNKSCVHCWELQLSRVCPPWPPADNPNVRHSGPVILAKQQYPWLTGLGGLGISFRQGSTTYVTTVHSCNFLCREMLATLTKLEQWNSLKGTVVTRFMYFWRTVKLHQCFLYMRRCFFTFWVPC